MKTCLPTFMAVSRRILRRMSNFLDKYCTENQNTHFVFKIFFPENLAVCEIMSINMADPDEPLLTIHTTQKTFDLRAG